MCGETAEMIESHDYFEVGMNQIQRIFFRVESWSGSQECRIVASNCCTVFVNLNNWYFHSNGVFRVSMT